MTKTFTKHFEINIENLKTPLSEFILKLKKQDDLFENYIITYILKKDEKQQPKTIKITLTSKYYLFPIWNLFNFFNKYVIIEKDISELEV